MNWVYKVGILLATVVIVAMITLILFPTYIQLISLVASIITIISIIFIFYPSKNYIKVLEKMIEKHNKEKEHLEKERDEQKDEITTIKEKYETEKHRTLHLSLLVDNIGITLNKENISKEELLEQITHPLKAIVFFKTWEDTDKKRERFINSIYPEMHVYGIRSGLSIIPPNHVPQKLSNDKILKWFKTEIERRVPPRHQFNIPFATVVDLTDIKHFDNLDPMNKRGHFSYLTRIPPEELVPPEMILSFLVRKRKLSTRDIIEIPNLLFLIDEDNITTEDKSAIMKYKDKIHNEIKRYLNIVELKTTDLANIDEKELTLILTDSNVKHPLPVAQMIIRNAKIWKIILERRIIS